MKSIIDFLDEHPRFEIRFRMDVIGSHVMDVIDKDTHRTGSIPLDGLSFDILSEGFDILLEEVCRKFFNPEE